MDVIGHTYETLRPDRAASGWGEPGPPVPSAHRTARAALRAARSRRAGELDRMLARLLGAEPDVALLAVGSHGRRELTPGGDLDLVLLHRDRPGVAALADRVWYPVWDAGIGLDHSVRTPGQARTVAGEDLRAALGLISARHVAGDPGLTKALREAVLADWRGDARSRLPELREMTRRRWADHGELAFLLEPDLKESRGGLRDVLTEYAAAASWVCPAPSERVREAYRLLLDVRHALHVTTGRGCDRLVLQEQDAVAQALGLLDADTLLRGVAEAARTVTHAGDHLWRLVERSCAPPRTRSRRPERRPLADGVVEHGGEVALARNTDVTVDPALVLRAAAAAAQAGLPLAIGTIERLSEDFPGLPLPWPPGARDALVTLLGAGPPAIDVWESLDQAGLIVRLLPDWERVRNRPQRSPVHTFTVDRHLVETAARAAAHTRDVARPDLLLLGALLHDIGKGWPGDHSRTGAVMARDIGERLGLRPADVDVLERVVRYHLLLPEAATRRDIDDPATIEHVAATVGDPVVLETLAALAVADGLATGPAAWGAWKAGLVAELARRVAAVLAGGPPRGAPEPTAEQLALARHGGAAVRVTGSSWAEPDGPAHALKVTVVAPDRPGLLWQAAGVLALHRLAVRGARTVSERTTAMLDFLTVPEYGSGPDPAALEADLRRVLAGRLDVAARLERRARSYRPRRGVPVPPPRVRLLDDASATATVVEVRAHDRPGLLWRIGRALGACGVTVRAARVETLGAEAVDVFYVVGGDGAPVVDGERRALIQKGIMDVLRAAG